MRSFTLSIFATLAFAVFSYAAPVLVDSLPVDAIAARHEGEHTEDVSLEVVLNNAIEVITPITEKLGCIDIEGATVENITSIVVELRVVLKDVIVKVNALASVPLERILCKITGDVLDAFAIAKLLAVLCKLVFGAFTSILAVVVVSVKVQILPLLTEVGCLVGSLLCAVLGLVDGLVVEIITCLLPQIIGCVEIMKILNVSAIISLLGL